MQKKMNIFAFVPLPGTPGIAQAMVNDVLPLVGTGQTRGGRILSQAVLKHDDGRYLWLVNYETTGGSWHEEHIAPARTKLETLAVVYASYELSLLKSEARQAMADEQFNGDFPIGQPGATVRIYQLKPEPNSNLERFHEALGARVLPAVNLHPPNRLGHSTDSQMLLKFEGVDDDGRCLWLISRSLHESFEDRDIFPSDIQNALEELNELGSIRGFSDYQLLNMSGLG